MCEQEADRILEMEEEYTDSASLGQPDVHAGVHAGESEESRRGRKVDLW